MTKQISKPTDYILSDLYHNQIPVLQYVIAELRKKVNKDSQLINKLQERVNELTENKPSEESPTTPVCNCASEIESIKETLRQLTENNASNGSSCDCADELESIRETLRQLTEERH